MNEPQLEDYGITPGQYALYKGTKDEDDVTHAFGCIVAILISLAIAYLVGHFSGNLGSAVVSGLVSIFFGFYFGPFLIIPALAAVVRPIVRFHRTRARTRLLKSDVGSKIKLYEDAKSTYHAIQAEAEKAQWRAEQERREAEQQWRLRRRQLHYHWMSLSGREFEWELATLYRHLGYDVESTPTSGDQGIDLILRKNGKTTIVQCKSHKSPVGPAVARELLGSMVAFGADHAILACTGGFTRGVKDFVEGKPMTLISAKELASMGRDVGSKTLPAAERGGSPVCPLCKHTMVLRQGKHGRFLGCPRYPKCTGTRSIAILPPDSDWLSQI